MRHVVVMVTTSYPRFAGDHVGTFMEPIAKRVAARGHDVHIVAPWHPLISRGGPEDGVSFHFFKYAPVPALNVFGYAAGMRADEALRGSAWLAAPFAMASGWFKAMRVAQKRGATVMHGHWVVPGGVIAAIARPALPLVVSLHGSDVFVAERTVAARAAARRVLARSGAVTACSQDLADRAIALGADAGRMEVVPYGVDPSRFRPSTVADRAALRLEQHLHEERVAVGHHARNRQLREGFPAPAAIPARAVACGEVRDQADVPVAERAEEDAAQRPVDNAHAAVHVPGADDEVAVPGCRHERRQGRGIVREVAVHLADEIGAWVRDGPRQAVYVRSPETTRSRSVDHVHPARVILCELIRDRPGAVRRTIVHDEETEAFVLQYAGCEQRQVLAFVIRRRDDQCVHA